MKKIIVLFLVIVFIMTSCSKTASSILTDNTCEAPCWRGITPGLTTKEEVQQKLYNMKDVDLDSIIETGGNFQYWQNGIGWSFIDSLERGGVFYFHDKKVIFLRSSFEINRPLSEIVEQYGEPDYVYATYGVIESMMKTITLVYSKGICIEINTRKIEATLIDSISANYSIDISDSEKVKSIEFFDKNLTSNQINTACYRPIEKEKIQKWDGYGRYNLYRN